jgi:hypothetical protein
VKPSAVAVLAELRARGDSGLTWLEALHAGLGSRLSGRVLELREAGHEISSTYETVVTSTGSARVVRYRLVERPAYAPTTGTQMGVF